MILGLVIVIWLALGPVGALRLAEVYERTEPLHHWCRRQPGKFLLFVVRTLFGALVFVTSHS